MTCLVAPLLNTMFVLCTVQTMPMSAVDRCVQFEDVDLAGLEVGEGVVEQLPRRRNTPRRERGNVEPQHVGAQCRVLCAPVIDSAISRTMEMMASLSCSVVVMAVLLSISRPVIGRTKEHEACPHGRCKAQLDACISPRGGLILGHAVITGHRGLLPSDTPEHQGAAALPSHRPAGTGSDRPIHWAPPLRHRSDPDRTGRSAASGRSTCPSKRSTRSSRTPDPGGPQRADRWPPPAPRNDPGPHPSRRPHRSAICSEPPLDAVPVAIEHRRMRGHAGSNRYRGHRRQRRQRLVPRRARRTACPAGSSGALPDSSPRGQVVDQHEPSVEHTVRRCAGSWHSTRDQADSGVRSSQ